VPLKLTLKSGDKIRGRIDMLRKSPAGIEIIDGKGTDKIGKNISEEQLYTYVILYKMVYGVWPDKIGFLYYKMRLIEYIDFTLDDIELYRKRFITTMIEAKTDEEYKATPSHKACQYCSYFSVCDEGKNRPKRKVNKKSAIKEEHTGSIQTFGL